MWPLDMFSKKMKYTTKQAIFYYSPRYKKSVTVPKGYKSDGATYAPDLSKTAFFVHDWLCEEHGFDDGVECTRRQASRVYADILKARGFWQHYHRRFLTYWFGGKKLRRK